MPAGKENSTSRMLGFKKAKNNWLSQWEASNYVHFRKKVETLKAWSGEG
jgi:hypothetical protein